MKHNLPIKGKVSWLRDVTMAAAATLFAVLPAVAQSEVSAEPNPHLAFHTMTDVEPEKHLISEIDSIEFGDDGSTVVMHSNPDGVPEGVSSSDRSWNIPGLTKIEFLDEPWTPSALKAISDQEDAFIIFPNPATDYFKVDGLAGPLALYSLSGECLMRFPSYKGEAIGVSHLSKGYYIVTIGNQAAKLNKK